MPRALASWCDGPARDEIVDFVRRVSDEGSASYVAPPGRIAVFDGDGTLWCEKPGPMAGGFLFRQLGRMAARDPSLAARQPWKAALERDHAWLGGAIERHDRGDGADLHALGDALLDCHLGLASPDYARAAAHYLRSEHHPLLGRPYAACTYAPMSELLRYLAAWDFTTCIVNGGTRDFMRSVAEETFGVRPENLLGTSQALAYREDVGDIVHAAAVEVVDDGATKPLRIWNRLGRRPILAAGNANGDIPMLGYCARGAGPRLCMLVHHDDGEREYAYSGGAEEALVRAARDGWTVTSMADEWRAVFPP